MKSKANTILTVLFLIAGIWLGFYVLLHEKADIPGMIIVFGTVIIAFLNYKKNFFKL